MTDADLAQCRSEVHNLKNDRDAMAATISTYESKIFIAEQECATYRLKFEVRGRKRAKVTSFGYTNVLC